VAAPAVETQTVTVAEAEAVRHALLPLTERVLRRLPHPRILWVVLWASVWPLGALIIPRLLPSSATVVDEGAAESLTTMYGALIALFGTAKLTRDLETIAPTIRSLTGGTADPTQVFHGVGSIVWPVILTGVMLMMWTGPLVLQHQGITALVTSAWGYMTWLPMVVLAWTAGTVLLGLNRLGGLPLHLRPFEDDRSLGLRPLGSLAFTPFLILVGINLPLLIFAPVDLRDVALNVGTLLLGVVLLFASLLRLRRQMLAAKATQVAWARGLYSQAVRGVRADGSLGGPQTMGRELAAAESLERHAAAIQEWPFEEGILRVMAAILTSLVTAILARLVLSRLGL